MMKGHDAVSKALLEHDKPPHAAVAVLGRGECTQKHGGTPQCLQEFFLKGIVVRKQRLHLRCDLLSGGVVSCPPDLIGKFLILPDAEPRAATVGGCPP